MAYFPDLSPYAYRHGSHPGVVHVGWLDNEHPYPTGSVDDRLIEKIRWLASKPVELYRGKHICELCVEPADVVKTSLHNRATIDPECSWAKWAAGRWSNGEIRVTRGGMTFAAPLLIVHYLEAHQYLPPDEFLKAIEETPGPDG